jgi:hypothetical protein
MRPIARYYWQALLLEYSYDSIAASFVLGRG